MILSILPVSITIRILLNVLPCSMTANIIYTADVEGDILSMSP